MYTVSVRKGVVPLAVVHPPFALGAYGQGEVQLLGRIFRVDPLWQHRLVRAELDLRAQRILFYTLGVPSTNNRATVFWKKVFW